MKTKKSTSALIATRRTVPTARKTTPLGASVLGIAFITTSASEAIASIATNIGISAMATGRIVVKNE